MAKVEVVEARWLQCVVAAPGPSLFPVQCDLPIIAVQDAYRALPWADVLYGSEPKWWANYAGDFAGELWSTHQEETPKATAIDDKAEAQEAHGVRLVRGHRTNPTDTHFSLDPSVINYGDNSGFQAINLAILFGCKRILLVGFDMKGVNQFRNTDDDHYERFIKFYDAAANALPSDIEIINCTPGSALKCFPTMELEDALLLDSITPERGRSQNRQALA